MKEIQKYTVALLAEHIIDHQIIRLHLILVQIVDIDQRQLRGSPLLDIVLAIQALVMELGMEVMLHLMYQEVLLWNREGGSYRGLTGEMIMDQGLLGIENEVLHLIEEEVLYMLEIGILTVGGTIMIEIEGTTTMMRVEEGEIGIEVTSRIIQE
jgi:hypothetical protein